jgi:hypothetical protein
MMTIRKRLVMLAGSSAVVLLTIVAITISRPRADISGPSTYNHIELGMDEGDVLRLVTMPSSRHGISGLNRGSIVRQTEDGTAHFQANDVSTTPRDDGSVLFQRRSDGQTVGWVRWWDTPRYQLVVVFGSNGKVIGRTLYEYEPLE